MKKISLLIIFSFLTGCQVVEVKGKKTINILPSSIPDSERFLSGSINMSKIEKIKLYENQLINDNQRYATIKTIPYAGYQRNDSLTPNPLMLDQLGERKIKFVKNKWFGSSSISKFEYSQAQLKVPVGKHNLILVNNFRHRFYYTELKDVYFDEGKNYILGEEKGKAFLAEYTIDDRFKLTDKDSIIIKKKIIQDIKIGNLKYVKNY